MIALSDLPHLKGFRFPRSVIGYAVWAYHRFALSLRDVEDFLAPRGITVSHETIRDWVDRLGVQFAAKLQRDRPHPADKWHLDEVIVLFNGPKHWLWRAVDANGDVLEILAQSCRNTVAAKWFFRKLLKFWGQPRVMVTDKLRSCGAVKAEVTPGIEHRQQKGLSNRAEASHRPTRRRGKIMGRFKSPGQVQRFLSFHDQPPPCFDPNATIFQPHPIATPQQTSSISGSSIRKN